jgi:cell wall-associated NlpC family hydrolase
MANKSGIAVAGLGAGLIFVMSGLKGWSLSVSVQDLLTGKNPSGQPQVNQITDIADSTSNLGNIGSNIISDTLAAVNSNTNIVNYAMQYRGGKYGWGKSGPPGTPVDCSGMINYIVGKAFGLPIPSSANGSYSGHGPVTMQWYVWSGATTVPANQMQPGDLCCWPTHMGMAINQTSMISALDTAQGVQVTTVTGGSPVGEGSALLIRRMTALNYTESLGSQSVTGSLTRG